jgi:hypothetical protein
MNQPDLENPPRSRAEERAILAVTCLAAFHFFNSFGSIGVALPAIQKRSAGRGFGIIRRRLPPRNNSHLPAWYRLG